MSLGEVLSYDNILNIFEVIIFCKDIMLLGLFVFDLIHVYNVMRVAVGIIIFL